MFFYMYETFKCSVKDLPSALRNADVHAYNKGRKRYGKHTIEIILIKKIGFRSYLSIIKVTKGD